MLVGSLIDTLLNVTTFAFIGACVWLMLPPGTPDNVVAAMRKAYATNWADKRTVANFSKATKSEPFWLAGEKAGALLSGYTNIGADAKAYLKSIIR